MQSCSPSADRFINCCTCAYSRLSLFPSSCASVSTANLQNAQGVLKHLAGSSHISLALFLQTWSWNWQITPYPACPTLSIGEFAPWQRSAPATCSIQRQQRAESEQMDGEKRACEERTFTNLRDARERRGGSVVLTALNSASDVCCSVSNRPLPPSLPLLSDSPSPAPLPPSAIKNRSYSVMRRSETPQRKSKRKVRTIVFKHKHMFSNVSVNTKLHLEVSQSASPNTKSRSLEEVVIATERRFRTSIEH